MHNPLSLQCGKNSIPYLHQIHGHKFLLILLCLTGVLLLGFALFVELYIKHTLRGHVDLFKWVWVMVFNKVFNIVISI